MIVQAMVDAIFSTEFVLATLDFKVMIVHKLLKNNALKIVMVMDLVMKLLEFVHVTKDLMMLLIVNLVLIQFQIVLLINLTLVKTMLDLCYQDVKNSVV